MESNDLLREIDIKSRISWYLLEVKNMIPFTTELISYKCKSGITFVISHKYAKIEVDSYDSLHREKEGVFIISYYLLSQFGITCLFACLFV